MAVEADHKHEYNVRDLGTRSVTLSFTHAHVVRDIKGVPLKVGFICCCPLRTCFILKPVLVLTDYFTGWDKSNYHHRFNADIGRQFCQGRGSRL